LTPDPEPEEEIRGEMIRGSGLHALRVRVPRR
jgi:hypothetical protein